MPLLFSWTGRLHARRAFLDAYVAFLVTFAVAFQWPLLHEMTSTALLSLPPLIVIPMWMALPLGIAHLVHRRCGSALGICAWVALMILAEYGLRAGPLAFPWSLIGHTQATVASVNGLAALGGVQLLSLVVLLVNATLFLAVRRSAPGAILTGLGVVIVAAISLSEGPPSVREVLPHRPRIAGIQPALAPRAWADLEDSSRVSLLLRLSRDAAAADSSIDLIVWPETAIPPRPTTGSYLNRIQFLVDSTHIPILAGAITTRGGGSAYRNSAVLSAPGIPVRIYDKVNLVPFAEQVPFALSFPFLERFAIPAGGVSGYEPGENRTIFEINDMRFGVLICFETLFGGASRVYAREGADVLVAITQDGWWGDSFGYRQHLEFNRLRAIETGLPLIQVAVSGISALIHPDGRVEETADWMDRSVWSVGVPPADPPTVFVQMGDWVTPLSAIAALAVLAASAMRLTRLKRSKQSIHEV